MNLHRAEKNPIVDEAYDYFEKVKQQYFANLGEHAVLVEDVLFFDEPLKRWDTVFTGMILVVIPRGYAQIKVWNQEKRKFEWHDFADYSLDATVSRDPFEPPNRGNGELLLWIREDASGQLYVTLPKDKGNAPGLFFDVLRTADIRTYGYSVMNNTNLAAALTAFVRYYAKEFIQENPRNRTAYNESCINCRYLIYLQVNDGIEDNWLFEKEPNSDRYKKDTKATAIIQQAHVMQLAQYGQLQPQALCPILQQYVDFEIVDEANESTSYEEAPYLDQRGRYRSLAPDELMIGGRIIKRENLRREGTKKICAECPFYHGRYKKGYKTITKPSSDSDYKSVSLINDYIITPARPGRQAIQVLVQEDGQLCWVTQYPSESYPNAQAFRVKGIGVTIYGSDKVNQAAKPGTPFKMEEFDVELYHFNLQVRQLYHAAFNWWRLSDEQRKDAIYLARSKPKNVSQYLSDKWDQAVRTLKESIVEYHKREGVRGRFDYPQRFFDKPREGAIEIDVEEVMSKVFFQAQWGVEYEDLTPFEFVNRLDPQADDFVDLVLLTDKEFVLVGGSPRDRELAAGALQYKLQLRVNEFLSGIVRAHHPGQELAKLRIAPSIVQYIKENAVAIYRKLEEIVI